MHQVRIDFYRYNLTGPLQQELCKSTLAGSDFDDQRNSIAACGERNPVKNGWASEEMLPQAPSQRLQPLTSMRLDCCKYSRILLAVGWPKEVAGVNSVNSSLFSRFRRNASSMVAPGGLMIV